jgi:methylglutaconyl-CoA hydratase
MLMVAAIITNVSRPGAAGRADGDGRRTAVGEDEAVRYAVTEAVATLTMDQPHNRNALTPALMSGLSQGLETALADEAVGVVVLTNSGPAFCAGADLSGGSQAAPAGGKRRGARRDGLAGLLTAIQDSAKPVVARIAGHCVAGGIGLAAACDISIADDAARFGFTEVRVGVAPAIISVVCLPKLRRADALELFLSGERISAARAAEVGLITRAVPAGDLDAEVVAVVAKLLAGGPSALAAAKRLVYTIPGMDREAAFTRTTEVSQALFASAEAAEGMAAFREKRLPSWAPPPGAS